MSQKNCVIVDGYRLSKEYVQYINSKGYKCIHVQSSLNPIPELSKSSTYHMDDYIENFKYENNIKSLAKRLKQYRPEVVIPGMESGVILADSLSKELNLKSNDFHKTKARRNKFEMIEELRKSNVSHMKYANVQTIEEALHWVAISTSYPVVIKPAESAGTEGVYICENEQQLKTHFTKIQGAKNCFGFINLSVLIEEFLRGTEYMVNSVSLKGRHYITDIWSCHKQYIPGHGMIYDREELLSSEGEIQDAITSYVNQVLTALGIENGAAHTEIIFTDSGPILIETGARVGGNVHCQAHRECLGINQLELTVDAYLDEKSFENKTQHPYQLKKNAMTILLSTQQEGWVESIPIEKTIKSCRSLYWYRLAIQPGQYIRPTRDLFSSPGKIILISEDNKLLQTEYQMLKQSMNSGFTLTHRVTP